MRPVPEQQWEGAQWQEVPSVTGQQALLANGVPAAATLPVYPLQGAVSVLNMSEALLASRTQWKASRYGAFSFAVADGSGGEFVFNVHANFSGAHAGPIFQNLVNDAILKSFQPGASITTTVTPLLVTANEVSTASSFDGFPGAWLALPCSALLSRVCVMPCQAVLASLDNQNTHARTRTHTHAVVVMIMLAFAFVPAAFALFVVRERETKAKHLQVVSGVSFISYWLSTWLFDFASYQIPMWLTVIILKAFSADALVGGGDTLWATIVLLELYGASVTGFTYLTSFAFAKHSMAQVGAILINFAFGR